MSKKLNNSDKANKEACFLCEDLLKEIQRFFDLLHTASKSYQTDWLTVEEIAKELRISKNVVYRLVRNGDIEAINIVGTDDHMPLRGHYRIKRASLNKFIEAKKVQSIPDESVHSARKTSFLKVKNHLGL